MWVLLPKGALSITMSHREPGMMQVRSRRKEWLDSFREHCPELGPDIKLEHADYQWRALAKPEHVAEAIKRITLAIDYSNFKNAAGDPRKGLKDPKLRGDYLHALHTIWGILLKAGDGGSKYDKPLPGATSFDEGTIDICARLGHWWEKRLGKPACCYDCGTIKPKDVSSKEIGKPTAAEVEAWWAAHPDVKRPRKPVPPAKGCPGGARRPVPGSTALHEGKRTGECTGCHSRQPLTSDAMGFIRWHKAPEAVQPPAAEAS